MQFVPLRKYALGGLAVVSSMAFATVNYQGTTGRNLSTKQQSVVSAESEIVRNKDSEECDCVPMWECMQTKCSGDICSSCEQEEKILRACLARVCIILRFCVRVSDFVLNRPKSLLLGVDFILICPILLNVRNRSNSP